MNCSHSINNQQCPNLATYWILNTQGERIPGGWVCEQCGRDTIIEIKRRMHWLWSLQPIDENIEPIGQSENRKMDRGDLMIRSGYDFPAPKLQQAAPALLRAARQAWHLIYSYGPKKETYTETIVLHALADSINLAEGQENTDPVKTERLSTEESTVKM